MSTPAHFPPPVLAYSAGARVPPNNLNAEQSLLGTLMLEQTTWELIADKVIEQDFYRPEHRVIFRVIRLLAEQQQPCDTVTLGEALEKRRLLAEAGGMEYLAEIDQSVATAANAVHYANIVRFNSVLRQLVRVGAEITDLAFNTDGRNEAELLDQAESKVFHIAEQLRRGGGFLDMPNLVNGAMMRIDDLHRSNGNLTGVATGFGDLDEKTSGLQPAELIIIAGRPSMGKTSFAMNIAEYAAVELDIAVAIFSMEMSSESLTMRLLSSIGRIEQQRVRSGRLLDEDWPQLTLASDKLSLAPLYIDDTGALSPTDVRARVRRLQRELQRTNRSLGLIVIDYIQLMQAATHGENRATEISLISRSLKALAKEMKVPVVALSQLNRTLETRPNKRPIMSDLRESGAIEQDADLIIFIYRDEVYTEDSPDKGTAEIIIGKQRNGPIGTVKLAFLGQFTRFENLATESYGDHY